MWIKDTNRKPAVTGETIAVVAVQAASSDVGSPAANLINGSGLRDTTLDGVDEHTSNPGQMWRSAKGEAQSWVEFDFGSPQKLGAISVWNYNEAWHANEGVRQMDISAWTPQTGWQKIRTGQQLDPGEGSNSYDEPTVIPLEAVTAQKIRFDALSNFGDPDYTGLSEVQFFGPTGLKIARPLPTLVSSK